MKNEISNNLMCILINGNIELWVEDKRLEPLKKLLLSENCPQFFYYEGRLINKNSITAILNPQDMEERTRRKNGEWACQMGSWHARGQLCECPRYMGKPDPLERMLACDLCNGTGQLWSDEHGKSFGCECLEVDK